MTLKLIEKYISCANEENDVHEALCGLCDS